MVIYLYLFQSNVYVNVKIPFIKISNAKEENTISKLKLQTDFLESYIFFLKCLHM